MISAVSTVARCLRRESFHSREIVTMLVTAPSGRLLEELKRRAWA